MKFFPGSIILLILTIALLQLKGNRSQENDAHTDDDDFVENNDGDYYIETYQEGDDKSTAVPDIVIYTNDYRNTNEENYEYVHTDDDDFVENNDGKNYSKTHQVGENKSKAVPDIDGHTNDNRNRGEETDEYVHTDDDDFVENNDGDYYIETYQEGENKSTAVPVIDGHINDYRNRSEETDEYVHTDDDDFVENNDEDDNE